MATGKARESVTRAPRTPNRALRGIRENERHETRAEFAEAMARVAREIGEDVYPDAKYVERLEAGVITWPRPPYRNILAKLCDRPIGELGFTAPLLSLSDAPTLGNRGSDNTGPAHINVPLRNAILASGMEITQLARQVDVNPKSVERWITKGRTPHARHRWKACDILGRDESELWPDAVAAQESPGSKSAVLGVPFRHGISGVHPGLSPSDIQPILRNLSETSVVSVIAALREVQRGYLMAEHVIVRAWC